MKVTNQMVYALQGTRGWVNFLGMLGFVIAFGMLTGSGISIYAACTKVKAVSMEQAKLFILAGALVFNALLVFYPASRLMAFGACCSQFALTKTTSALYQGLIEHRRFWQYWGIFTILVVILNGMVAVVFAMKG